MKPIVEPPSPRVRRWINIGAIVFLSTQVAWPLTYYFYKEPTDERFAWRMFSSVHMIRWDPPLIVEKGTESGETWQRRVPIQNLLIESSWRGLESNQPDIRDKFLKSRLKASRADEVIYHASGTWPSGKRFQSHRYVLRRGESTLQRQGE